MPDSFFKYNENDLGESYKYNENYVGEVYISCAFKKCHLLSLKCLGFQTIGTKYKLTACGISIQEQVWQLSRFAKNLSSWDPVTRMLKSEGWKGLLP